MKDGDQEEEEQQQGEEQWKEEQQEEEQQGRSSKGRESQGLSSEVEALGGAKVSWFMFHKLRKTLPCPAWEWV